MAVSKKTNATKKTKEATPVDTKKKVTFAQEKRVKMFHKDKALLKRKAIDDQEQQQQPTPSAKKTKSAIRQAAAQQKDAASSDEEQDNASSDEAADGVANDTELDALTEEQEEALRKEILGDLVDDDEDSDEDSSDDDQDDNIGENDNVVSLSKKKIQSNAKKVADVSSTSGWVYVGRIPDAFTEQDMRTYFEQFGDIAHIRISRNKRGRSRHYGFIEFVAQDVAEIVVETMHNYMLDGRLLQCKLIPLERRNPHTFDDENKPLLGINAPIDRQRRLRNRDKGMQTYITRAEQLVKSEEKKRQRLKDLNIDYEFPGYAASKLQWEAKFKAKLEQEIKANELLKNDTDKKKKNNKASAKEQSQPAKVTVS